MNDLNELKRIIGYLWTRMAQYVKENKDGYVHPSFTPAESGLYKITVNDQGHVTAVEAVTKEDIEALGFDVPQYAVLK